MKQIHIKMKDELHSKIIAKADEQGRSLNQHIIHIIERDLNTVEIPFEGTITKDGTITSKDGIITFKARGRKWTGETLDEEIERRR